LEIFHTDSFRECIDEEKKTGRDKRKENCMGAMGQSVSGLPGFEGQEASCTSDRQNEPTTTTTFAIPDPQSGSH